MNEDTSAYWRKLLDLNSPLDPKILKKARTRLAFLRPAFYAGIKWLSDRIAPVETKGAYRENLKPPFILASNHVSILDFPALVIGLPPEIRDQFYAPATRHFYDIPPARFFMKLAANVIRIDREGDFFPSLKTAAQVLRAGSILYIAPEATRSHTGDLLPFKVGVGVLAVELGVPIVPAYIRGTDHILGKGKLLPKKGKITVIYGQPIDPKPFIEMKKEKQAYDVYQAITEVLRGRVLELSKLPY